MAEDTTVPALAGYRAQIPEDRAARGRRHPPLPLLLLTCVALRCGARSPSALADWGRHHGRPWLRRLGFTRDRAPSQPTLSRLFQGVPHRAVEAALGRWAEQALRCCPAPPGALEGLALDGKTLRGSKRRGAADAHLPAAFGHRRGVTLGQVGVPDKTNEIGAASAFLRDLVLEGRVVTADAPLTQRAIAQAILAGGGDYPLVVKEHPPTLHAAVAAACAPEAAAAGLVGRATTVTQHGDRVECRTLTASTAPVGDSEWPGLRQALRIERRVLHKGTGRVLRSETAYAVTSLPPRRAAPAQLARLRRPHWGIEHRLHDIRNAAIGLIRCLGATKITATCRQLMAQPLAAFLALGVPPDLE